MWNFFQNEIANEDSYNISIRALRLKPPNLQSNNNEIRKLQTIELSKVQEYMERVFQYKSLLYILKIIWYELISYHHNNFLEGDFEINKIWKLISTKYYYLLLCQDNKAYIKGCNICLASKIVWYKPYRNLQSLSVPI